MLATVVSMLILANMLIEIVSQTYGEVAEKKYLFVFKERIDLINDWQSVQVFFRTLVRMGQNIIFAPMLWCCGCFGIHGPVFRKIRQVIRKREMIRERCSMLITAWEDPEAKDSTIDVV